MEVKVKIGSALPNDGWQYMGTKDPAPRTPWCIEAPVSKRQAINWTIVAIGALVLTYALTRVM